jgi:hypothetical protein
MQKEYRGGWRDLAEMGRSMLRSYKNRWAGGGSFCGSICD